MNASTLEQLEVKPGCGTNILRIHKKPNPGNLTEIPKKKYNNQLSLNGSK
jgi:hypothetical protein